MAVERLIQPQRTWHRTWPAENIHDKRKQSRPKNSTFGRALGLGRHQHDELLIKATRYDNSLYTFNVYTKRDIQPNQIMFPVEMAYWIILCTFSMSHTDTVWIGWTTRTMQPKFLDQRESQWIRHQWQWNLQAWDGIPEPLYQTCHWALCPGSNRIPSMISGHLELQEYPNH